VPCHHGADRAGALLPNTTSHTCTHVRRGTSAVRRQPAPCHHCAYRALCAWLPFTHNTSHTCTGGLQRCCASCALPPLRFPCIVRVAHFHTQHLTRVHRGTSAVRRQLCLAIIALTVHVPAQNWGEGEPIMWLASRILRQPPDLALPCLLELLTLMPQVGAKLGAFCLPWVMVG